MLIYRMQDENYSTTTNTNDYLLTLNKGFLDIEGVQELKYKKTLKK